MRANWVGVVIVSLSTLLGSCGGSEVAVPTPHNLRISVSDATWVAYQDGDGTWQPLPENTVASLERTDMASLVRDRPHSLPKRSRWQHPRRLFTEPRLEPFQEKTYSVAIQDADGRYGLAYVCADPEYGDADISIELTTVEDASETFVACYFGDDEPLNTLSGQVKGLGPADTGVVYAGFDYLPVSSDSPSYRFELYRDLYDVIATRFAGSSSAPSSIVIERDVPVNEDKLVDLDFGSNAAFTPELRSVQINGEMGESLRGGVTLSTDNYTFASLGQLAQGTTFDYAVIPAQKLGSSARYYLYAEAGDSLGGATVSVGRALTTPVDSSLTLPEPLASANAVVGSNTPYPRPTATWSSYPGERVSYDNFYSQLPDDGPFVSAYVYIDASWLPSADEFAYTIPDFTGVAGWQNAWGLKPEVETSWSVAVYSGTGTYGEDGYEEVSSDISGSINAPITLVP